MATLKTVADVRAWLRGELTLQDETTPPVVQPQAEFPIANYDALGVRDILALLHDLDDAQKQQVAEYEAANRQRKTVLEAVG